MIDQIKVYRWTIFILFILVIALWFFPDAIKGALTGAASAVKSGMTGLF